MSGWTAELIGRQVGRFMRTLHRMPGCPHKTVRGWIIELIGMDMVVSDLFQFDC